MIDEMDFAIFNEKHQISQVKVLKSQIDGVFIDFASVRNYFVRTMLQKKLIQMQEAGLIEHYIQKYAKQKFTELVEEPDVPKVFRLDQLAIGFQVFLLFLALAVIVFIFERLSLRLPPKC